MPPSSTRCSPTRPSAWRSGTPTCADPETVSFVCECGNRACAELVQMTFEEYERVRSDSHTFLVVPGHELPEAEEVVQRTERFHVVAKVERTQRIVESTDLHQ